MHPTAYYQLYRTYLQREVEENFSSPFCEDCNSEFWAARVVERYPDSEWAILVENPDYADKEEVRRQTERAAYEALLARYYAKAYVEVMRETAGEKTEPFEAVLADLLGGFETRCGDVGEEGEDATAGGISADLEPHSAT